VVSNNGIRPRAYWRRLAGLFRGPPGGALLLILIVSASAWLLEHATPGEKEAGFLDPLPQQ